MYITNLFIIPMYIYNMHVILLGGGEGGGANALCQILGGEDT